MKMLSKITIHSVSTCPAVPQGNRHALRWNFSTSSDDCLLECRMTRSKRNPGTRHEFLGIPRQFRSWYFLRVSWLPPQVPPLLVLASGLLKCWFSVLDRGVVGTCGTPARFRTCSTASRVLELVSSSARDTCSEWLPIYRIGTWTSKASCVQNGSAVEGDKQASRNQGTSKPKRGVSPTLLLTKQWRRKVLGHAADEE